MAKQLTCGVVFVDTKKQKILMIHPTYQKDFWDLPKGRQEKGETPLEAAVREVYEETSIVLDPIKDKLIDYGRHPYNKHKQIHLFTCVDKDFDVYKLKCTSMVEGLRTVFPEVDDFELFSIEEAKELMCPAMKKVFSSVVEEEIREKLI